EERAMRRPFGSDRDVPARQARLVDRGAANIVRHLWISRRRHRKGNGTDTVWLDQSRASIFGSSALSRLPAGGQNHGEKSIPPQKSPGSPLLKCFRSVTYKPYRAPHCRDV